MSFCDRGPKLFESYTSAARQHTLRWQKTCFYPGRMGKTLRARDYVRKTPTGIAGLDEISFGGLSAGRPTLVCGSPGSGKTLLGISFLVNGAVRYDEPGVLMSFKENAEELAQDEV